MIRHPAPEFLKNSDKDLSKIFFPLTKDAIR